MPKYDFLAIGDVTTDAFIRLETPAAHIDVDKGRREIAMRFAAKIPYKEVHVVPGVGNSPNAAVAASRLGLKSSLVSNIGGDYFGEECLQVLKKEKVGTRFVRIHKNSKTNYHYVLWFDDDRTILIKHQPYSYRLPSIGTPGWIYLSSLGENSLPLHSEIERYLNRYPKIKLAFQPGTFQMKFGWRKLKSIYKRTDVFFCNKEEAQGILDTDEKNIKRLLDGVCALGPKMAVITDGRKGAYVKNGPDYWKMPIYPDPKPPLERTGAGDAFSSTFTVVLAHGLGVEEALLWAPINSMSVVQRVGAQAGLLTRRQIANYLKKAPKDYKPRRI